jgi:hypothetical protein
MMLLAKVLWHIWFPTAFAIPPDQCFSTSPFNAMAAQLIVWGATFDLVTITIACELENPCDTVTNSDLNLFTSLLHHKVLQPNVLVSKRT